jgi:hypothetical protein
VEDFDDPVFGVFAVEEGDPTFFSGGFLGGGAAGKSQK